MKIDKIISSVVWLFAGWISAFAIYKVGGEGVFFFIVALSIMCLIGIGVYAGGKLKANNP